jgi:hypothetical protein
MHDPDLPGGSPKADKAQLQPEIKGFFKTGLRNSGSNGSLFYHGFMRLCIYHWQ